MATASRSIFRQVSQDALKVGEGSLYPALQRLLLNDFVVAEWGLSENNRKARFYKITAAGRKQLAPGEEKAIDALLVGIARVMETVMKLWKRNTATS